MALNMCQFQGCHKDKLGFLIGSGPSLKDFDKSLLSPYVTMSVNSSILFYEECDYFVSDDWSITNWSYYIRILSNSKCIKFLYEKKFHGRESNLKKNELCMFDHTWYYEPKTGRYNMNGLVLHNDCHKPIIGARTSLASGLNIMEIMGCNPIVLIGCDGRMIGDKRYFWEYPGFNKPVRLDRRGSLSAESKRIEGLKQCSEIVSYWSLFSKMNKSRMDHIINATVDSSIDVFHKDSVSNIIEKYSNRSKNNNA